MKKLLLLTGVIVNIVAVSDSVFYAFLRKEKSIQGLEDKIEGYIPCNEFDKYPKKTLLEIKQRVIKSLTALEYGSDEEEASELERLYNNIAHCQNGRLIAPGYFRKNNKNVPLVALKDL